MATAPDNGLGTKDLEKGLRPSPASAFLTPAAIVLMLLLVFNSAGLLRWTERLPANPATAWMADRASDWHRLMVRLGPAVAFDSLRRLLKVD
jgi:hypothetical protein